MGTEILISVRPNETRVAYVEEKTLIDLKVEPKTHPTFVGSVFRGKVLRVLPGMQAAFVDIGLERAAFLYVDDVRQDSSVFIDDEELATDETGSADPQKSRVLIQDLLQEGQLVMAQVAKDPLGTKGARITTHISLPGRTMVYLPTVPHRGISRKIVDEVERERLKAFLKTVPFSGGGMIVRTAGEGLTDSDLLRDVEYLSRTWSQIEKVYQESQEVGLVHADIETELRALRDLLSEKVDRVWVDDTKTHQKALRFVEQMMPKFKDTISLYERAEPLFDFYEIDFEISRSLDRKVWLKSGGSIVIDEAEALVVIDVNTGKFVGKKDLEDTILKTNLEAAKEIAHQLRVRNCGGIIIIDFIDMEKPVHREKVMALFQDELKRDFAKTTMTTMSELGLVEMTRKRTRPSLLSRLCEPCSFCEGKGYLRRKRTIANEIFRELERDQESLPENESAVVHCHGDVAHWILTEELETIEFYEKKIQKPIVLVAEPHYHPEQYEIRGNS